VDVFVDLAAEQDRLDQLLAGLNAAEWTSPSAAAGWTIADVVLHLAQSDEGVVASVGGSNPREDTAVVGTVGDWAARMVNAERAAAMWPVSLFYGVPPGELVWSRAPTIVSSRTARPFLSSRGTASGRRDR